VSVSVIRPTINEGEVAEFRLSINKYVAERVPGGGDPRQMLIQCQ